jgi:hypothetical protein
MERAGYTIRIFVADGDPEGIRVIDQMNWTGTGIVFPRALWPKVKQRKEFDRAGVYILVGYGEGDGEDLPRIYVGEGDGIRARIDQHDQKKTFWERAICFISNANALNKAHVQWLEHRLVQIAKENGQCVLDNGNEPQAPALSEHEQADVAGFLDQMLRILPLVNLRVFEKTKPVAITSSAKVVERLPMQAVTTGVFDTIVVPAQKDGFDKVFLGASQWYAIRIAGAMLDKIKYCAAYQSAPASAITHLAPVKQVEPYGDAGKYRLVFSEAASPIGPIPFGDATPGSMQGPRYTSIEKLRAAKKVSDLF